MLTKNSRAQNTDIICCVPVCLCVEGREYWDHIVGLEKKINKITQNSRKMGSLIVFIPSSF